MLTISLIQSIPCAGYWVVLEIDWNLYWDCVVTKKIKWCRTSKYTIPTSILNSSLVACPLTYPYSEILDRLQLFSCIHGQQQKCTLHVKLVTMNTYVNMYIHELMKSYTHNIRWELVQGEASHSNNCLNWGSIVAVIIDSSPTPIFSRHR